MMTTEGEELERAECVYIQLMHGLEECSDEDEYQKQGVAVDWQCPVAIIKKVKAVLTNNKRVPYAVQPRLPVFPCLIAEDF